MDDEDCDDLFGGGNMLEDSSQESLTNAAANLAFCESNEERDRESTPASDVRMKGVADCMLKTKRTSEPASKQRPQSHVPPQPTNPASLPLSRSEDSVATTSGAAESAPLVGSSTVIDRIERAFERIADDMLSKQDEIGLTLNVRSRAVTVGGSAEDSVVKTRRICFPGRSAEEAWRFSVVIRILELMHEALRTGVTISKRDMYYRDPALFGSQAHVDRYVDDIAYTFSVPRSALNVAAVAKGLVVGAIIFCRRDGSTVSAAADRDGMLVPSLKEVLSVDMSSVRWIAVIEKEASFRSIAASRFWDKLSAQGVLITGKGYPDIATRALLRFLCTPSPQNGFAAPLVYGLVDFDPDGLAILSTYKHGSIALAHESAELRVPQLKWLGLRSEHKMLDSDSTHASQGLLTLTARDRSKAQKMLERSEAGDSVVDDDEAADYRHELQVMLMLNMKAELQLLDAVPDGMTILLESQLGCV